jgi:hypothetical protein
VFHDGLREALDVVEVASRCQRQHHVQPLAAAGLQPARQTQFGQQGACQQGAFLHGLPSHPFAGVEVENHAIRLAQQPVGGVPCVKIDHVHLRGRRQCFARGHLEQRIVPGPQRRIQLANAGDGGLAIVLLEEDRRADPARAAYQRHRAPLQVRQHEAGHFVVVAHQFEFGGAGSCVDDPVAMGDFGAAHSGTSPDGCCGGRCGDYRHLTPDVAGRLVVAQRKKGRMANVAGR